MMALRKLRFLIERSTVGGVSDAAYLSDDDDWQVELVSQVAQDLSTDVHVTVAGVTMFLAAWEDVEHWQSDWAEKLNIEHDDVPDAVAALLASAIEAD